MATIRDIAALANVSSATVSRVLNHDETISVSLDTRRKIFEAAEELSYQKPQRVNKQSTTTHSLALVHWYDETQELNDPYFLSIRLGIEDECKFNDISLTKIYNNGEGKYEFPEKKYDGIIVLGKFEKQQCDDFKKYCENIILVHGTAQKFEFDSVIADFEEITKDVLDCIFEKGHLKIGYIGGREKIIGSEIIHEDVREIAFCNYLKQHGLYDENLIKIGFFNYKEGYRMMQEIVDNCEALPTCLFIGSDTLAIGALRALNERNIKVPEQIAIISCNDIPTSKYTFPTLSTVKIYTEFMGRQSVKIFLEQKLEPRKEKIKVVVPHRIIIRESF